MEIEAVATHVDRHSSNNDESREVVCCARARFIFVALNKEGRVREMPQWTPRTDHERTLEAHARKRYELKKKKRVAKKSANGSG